MSVPGDFDVRALFEAVDAQRVERDMTWNQVNSALAWMSTATLLRMRDRATSSCNHILPLIQWVGRTPESFTVDPEGAVHELLPEGRWRWWWQHHDLAAAVDAQRQDRAMTWDDVAAEIGIDVKAMKAVDKARYGPTIGVAMILARWVQRSAASFMSELPPQAFNR